MNHDQQVPEDGQARTAGEVPAAIAPPMVVVEYRSRGVSAALIAPLVLLLLAVAISSYQRQTPVRSLSSISQPIARAAPDTAVVGLSPSQGSASEPLVVRLDQSSAPPPVTEIPKEPPKEQPKPAEAPPGPETPPPAAEAAETVASSNERPVPPPAVAMHVPSLPLPEPARERDDALPGAGSVENKHPLAEPAPVEEADRPEKKNEVTKEEVEASIRQEAAETEQRERVLADAEPNLRAMGLLEALRKTQERRVAFHNALREILKTAGNRSGEQIESLCEEYGRTPDPQVKATVMGLLKHRYTRYVLSAKAEMMRAYGLPEPMILDYVARTLDRYRGTRAGPRDQDQVIVQAARVLLTMPPKRNWSAVETVQNLRAAASLVHGNPGATPPRAPSRHAQ